MIAGAGVGHTLRFGSSRPVVRARLGSTLLATVTPLADGTDAASSVRVIGHSRNVRVKATIVASSRTRLVLSAAGSVFSVGALDTPAAGRRAHLATRAPAPGEAVDATLVLSATTVQPTSVQSVGQASLIDVQGVLAARASRSIVLSATAGALTTVSVPASLSLPPTIAVGDQAEVVAAYSGGAFSLVTILDDALAATASAGAASPLPVFQDGSSQSVEIEGIVVATPTASGTTALTGTAGTLTATATTTGCLPCDPARRPRRSGEPCGPSRQRASASWRRCPRPRRRGHERGLLTLLRLTVQQSPGTDGSPQATSSGPAASGGSSPSCPPGNQGSGHGGDHGIGADHGGGCGSGGDN